MKAACKGTQLFSLRLHFCFTRPVIPPGTEEGGGRIVFNKPTDAMGIVHTHPHGGGLSPRDIQTAKENHLTVYAIDLDGLHAVGPDGKITEVYRSVGDLIDKKKKTEVQPIRSKGSERKARAKTERKHFDSLGHQVYNCKSFSRSLTILEDNDKRIRRPLGDFELYGPVCSTGL